MFDALTSPQSKPQQLEDSNDEDDLDITKLAEALPAATGKE